MARDGEYHLFNPDTIHKLPARDEDEQLQRSSSITRRR
jgi:hypothetical protein